MKVRSNSDWLRDLRAAGFDLERLSTGYGVGPRPFAYLYRGVARPAGEPPALGRSPSVDTVTREEVGHIG